MKAKLCLLIFTVFLQCEFGSAQRQWVSPQTTAQEMWNPYTWYRPYYQAAAEAYSQYYQNAQDIRNQLWQQAYATGAFGGGGGNQPGGAVGGATGGAGNQVGQAGSQVGGATGAAGGQPQNWG